MAEQDSKKNADKTDKNSTSGAVPSKQVSAGVDETQKLKIIYISFAASSVLMFTPIQPIPLVASLTMIGIVLLCYLSAKFGKKTPFSPHYRWLIRTFWIGLWLFLPFVTILGMGILLKFGDKAAFDAVEQAGDAALLPNDMGLQQFMADNGVLGLITMFTGWISFGAWWFTRIWRGFKGLQSGSSFQFKDVTSWWVRP
ncbi:MAG: hypothetical protein HND56_01950 [Pseudomonadota bacterium]|jgi:uncharacterized membrane protein|nr:hypothetical protein [Pseudomonadota bacterium]QKK04524.1 MAG: hypothetical protein HND56_01950 [Pseudomonadota bacterium]|tara:strand:+ start:249 stop:842 length:594 start_codon:yes stop_codon:yes gene_type:complete